MQEIRITFGPEGLKVEANTPPVVTLGLMELAKASMIREITEPQSEIVTPTPSAIKLVTK